MLLHDIVDAYHKRVDPTTHLWTGNARQAYWYSIYKSDTSDVFIDFEDDTPQTHSTVRHVSRTVEQKQQLNKIQKEKHAQKEFKRGMKHFFVKMLN